MYDLIQRFFGTRSNRPYVRIIRKVKHSDYPALTNARHGTALLKGKVEKFVVQNTR